MLEVNSSFIIAYKKLGDEYSFKVQDFKFRFMIAIKFNVFLYNSYHAYDRSQTTADESVHGTKRNFLLGVKFRNKEISSTVQSSRRSTPNKRNLQKQF